MLHIGRVPDGFGIGLTSPIPKFKGFKNCTTADDYRAVTVNPVISKIFEHCIMDFISKNTRLSTRQFGFKKKVGCINSIHTIRKVINYFSNRKSTISIAIVDLRKAFDKCNTFGILCSLQKHNVNVEIINILENWFSKNCNVVKWSGAKSDVRCQVSGVKQGGILSPLLFSIFVDTILNVLEDSNLGCFVNYCCYNSFMYADDLILLSISVSDLQNMIDICASVCDNLDLPINLKKCQCISIEPKFKGICTPIRLREDNLE